MSNLIRTYWALSQADSKKYQAIVIAENETRNSCLKDVQDKTGCDSAFINESSGAISLGYKEKIDHPQLHKKPFMQFKEYHLYKARAKTDFDFIVSENIKKYFDVEKFKSVCEQDFKLMLRDVFYSSREHHTIRTSTGFGFVNGQVIAMVPFNSGEFDRSIICDGFYEITAGQLEELENPSKSEQADKS